MTLDGKSKIAFACALPLLLLDVILYILSFQWISKLLRPKTFSVAVGEETATHGCPRRSTKSPNELIASNRTLYDMIQNAAKQYGKNTALVSRKFLELKKLKPADRFPTKIYDDNDIEEISYEELGEQIQVFGAGLRALGMEPIPQLKEGETFDNAKGPFVMVIFEDTCKQWTIGMHGALSQSMTVATCYATLGEDAVVSAVNETRATTLLLNWKRAEKFASLSDTMPTLKTIIASTYEMPEGTPTPLPPKRNSKVTIISTDELLNLGERELEKYPPVPPKLHDVAVIMYTSGSTGKARTNLRIMVFVCLYSTMTHMFNSPFFYYYFALQPKGVLMTHEQLTSGVSGMRMNVKLRPGKECVISYLPLAHVLALQIENALLNAGAKVCYSDARQLAKTLGMFHPTVHAGVPKVYEILQGALLKKLEKGPAAAQVIFNVLFAWKSFLLSIGMDAPMSNTLFFRQISNKVFGGVLQFAVSGGGPLNANLHNFFRVCFCCPFIQGYALTETCVGGCFQDTKDPRGDVVGPPVPCVEVMLQSEPEFKDSAGLPYLYTDTVNSKGEAVIGRGEICMRGPCISSGYYRMPEKTKEEYDEDGWFHTGDIGQFTADGVIQIIDRKKNIVKLKGGEYVAVEAMESAFSESPFVSLICVLADGDLDRPLAVVDADDKYLATWATENNIKYDSLADLADMEVTRKAAVKSMVDVGKGAGLTSLEVGIKDCCIVTDTEWGPGHGMTASMKLDRAKICSMHADEVNAMYERNGVEK